MSELFEADHRYPQLVWARHQALTSTFTAGPAAGWAVVPRQGGEIHSHG